MPGKVLAGQGVIYKQSVSTVSLSHMGCFLISFTTSQLSPLLLLLAMQTSLLHQRAGMSHGAAPWMTGPPCHSQQMSCSPLGLLATGPSGIGFAWQGFGSSGATGVASVRSCQKLPPRPTEPMPAVSKTDPPLAEAEPISDGGSAFGITC